jgi:hypothetical protein
MKQYEQVVTIMKKNGGFATLGFLNQKVDASSWQTKTPFATIRRIVQDDRLFFKVKPGLWALKSEKEKLPLNILPQGNVEKKKIEEFNHAYYQGLLLEIGNNKKMQTFVPYQDKNKEFLNKKLGVMASIDKFYNFTYENIVRKAITIDVSWFNKRKMPSAFFEVEHSTDIQNSLIKFIELQDFNTQFFIVADKIRQREFDYKLSLNAFNPIKEKVQFISYEKLSDWHTKTYEIIDLEKNFHF